MATILLKASWQKLLSSKDAWTGSKHEDLASLGSHGKCSTLVVSTAFPKEAEELRSSLTGSEDLETSSDLARTGLWAAECSSAFG